MEQNSILVGDKPFLNYVTGVVMQFTMHEESTVVVKARGKYITRAVDIAEVTRTRFLEGCVAVRDVAIGSENARSKEGHELRVSTIEITLART